jgi:pyruvate dehydrogenase E2 component (dihydrolipoamide acetyltransferase)
VEEIFVPASGMAMEDALFVEWLKAPGELVGAGEAVAVVETDKSTVELSGTTAGRLSRHLVAVGDRVLGGTTVAYVLADGETEPGGDAAAAPAGGTGPAPSAIPEAADGVPAPAGPAGREADGRHRLSPRQRRALAETGPAPGAPIDQVPQGRTEPDGAGAPSRNREATAQLVTESWRTIPHFSVGRDIRVDGLTEAVAIARAGGTAATVTDFLVVALARALEAQGELPDVGLAVATEWGVLVPVLRPLSGRSLADVAALRTAAVGRARSRRLESADTAGVFATLSNLGTAGVSWFTGVVPVGQVALLTVGEISLRPAVEGRGLVVAPVLTAIVTADHRRYDGTDSARLLGSFAGNLTAVIAEGDK